MVGSNHGAAVLRLRHALGVWVLLVLAFAGNQPYFEQTRNANERPRIMQAMAWIDDGEWAIDGRGARGLDAGPDTARSTHDGRLYPNKPPGATLPAAGGYVIARGLADDEGPTLRDVTAWGRLLGGALPSLLLAMVLWRRYAPAFGTAAAMAAVLTWAIGTPSVVYSHLLYGHALAAALLHGGIVAMAVAFDQFERKRAIAWCTAGGALAGSAVAVEYVAAFAAIPIAVAWVMRLRAHKADWPLLVAATVGALVPVLLLAGYHDHAFGSPWSTGYQHATVDAFAQKHGQGLLGLGLPTWQGIHTHLLSVDGGLLWWAPAVVPGMWGLVLATRVQERRFEAWVHLLLVAVFLWINISLSFEGGWRVGPRYFVIALPSFVIGWAELYGQARTRPVWVAGLFAVATYGVLVNGLAANLWPHFDLSGVDAPVTEVLLPLFHGDSRPYVGWGTMPGRVDLVTVVVGASAVGFALVWVRLVELRLRTMFALAIGLALAVVGVASHSLLPGNPKATRNLAYIDKTWEPKQSAGRSVVLHPVDGDAPSDARIRVRRSSQ